MPIYECHCVPCALTFEAVAPVSDANRRQHCPECGRLSRRIASTFAIVSGGARVRRTAAQNGAKVAVKRGNAAPLCLQYPHIPLLCHMDEGSARRWVAHYDGRGAEYDDRLEARAELRKKRGLPPGPPPVPADRVNHAHKPRGVAPTVGRGADSHSPANAHAHSHASAGNRSGEGGAQPSHPHAHPH